MGFFCGVGKGKNNDTRIAAQQAVASCCRQLEGRNADLLLLFMSPLYDEGVVLNEIQHAFSDTPLLGCSSAGEIYSSGPDEKSIALVAFCGIQATVGRGGDMVRNAFEAGRELGQKFMECNGNLMITLCDGMAGDGAAIIKGILSELKTPPILLGGAAGDDAVFQSTDLYLNHEILTGTVIGVRLHGDFYFGVGIRHGWEPVGLPVKATRSEGNRLIEINGYPAIRLYEEYFGEYTKRLRSETLTRLAIYYPLGFAVPETDDYLLRAPLSVEDNGTIRFTAEVPNGTAVRLMIGSVDGALEAARQAARDAVEQMQGRPIKLAVIINAVSRRRLFGPKAQDEIHAVQAIIGKDVPLVGFYAYGEIAPFSKQEGTKSYFHNETILILTLG